MDLYNMVLSEKIAGGGGGSYILPIASASTLGGIKVGNNLSIDDKTGELSAVMPNIDLSNMIGNGDIYSTDEKLIGQWTDGKPLYQKVCVLNGSDVNLDDNNNIGLSNINIYGAFGVVYMTDGAITPLTYINASSSNFNNCAGFFFNSSLYLCLRFGRDQRNVSKIYLILRYTKTTDTAQAIGNANDYSTTEKIVGTWIDGSEIYQRTWTGLIGASTPNTEKTIIDLSSLNIDKLIYIDGFAYEGIPLNIFESSEYYMSIKRFQNSIVVKSNGWLNYPIQNVTLQYTKSL